VTVADSLLDQEIVERQSTTRTKLSNLPMFQPTVIKLMAVSLDSDSARDKFETAFQSDPGLASELLLAANSAEFCLRARVGSIGHALSVLGLERTRSLVTRIGLRKYSRLSPAAAELKGVWLHSIATAALAERIAVAFGLSAPSVYTAALLHDIGRLGCLLADEKRYREVSSLKGAGIRETAAVEKVAFGFTHCEAGGFLTRTWGFPDDLRACTIQHHDPPPDDVISLLHCVQLACGLSASLGFGELCTANDVQEGGALERTSRKFFRAIRSTPENLQSELAKQVVAIAA
jgi:putative nucleotidyltransferase with HDIG domain